MATKRARNRNPGRPAGKNTGATRARILRVARKSFSERGFAKTTMRGVAMQANVDAALVHYFFHSKEQLFAEAIDLPVPVVELRALLVQKGRIGKRVVRFFLDEVFGARNQSIAAVLRTALAEPTSVPALRARIEAHVVDVLCATLPQADGRLRAEILGAQVVGLFVMRSVLRLEPISSASPAAVASILGPCFDRILGRR